MAKRVSERRLVDVLVSFFRQEHDVLREVRFYEKRIDIVVALVGGDEVWAIEVKVSDWQRASRQAVVNLAAADRSFIAVQADFVHRVRRHSLLGLGLGLISVGPKWGQVDIIETGEQSLFINRLVCQRLRETLRRGGTA